MTQKFTRADETIDTFGAMEHAHNLQRRAINLSLRSRIRKLVAWINFVGRRTAGPTSSKTRIGRA